MGIPGLADRVIALESEGVTLQSIIPEPQSRTF